jgi:glycosyltransferase involved in cell wall biosynthesis
MSQPSRRLRIGLAVMTHSRLGHGGGLDIYARSLTEALADYDPANDYVVLSYAADENAWAHRQWPANVSFVKLHTVEPRQPWHVRAGRRAARSVGLPAPAHYGEPYLARQIDGLGLDLIHYPCTEIAPLSLQTTCVLGFSDMQHEYYPQFFTQADLELRAKTYRPSVDKAVSVIAPSGYTRHTLVERYGTPPGKVEVIAHGLAESFRRASVEGVERTRLKYGLPKEYLYYPANPWPHKNHARLMAALRILRERYGGTPALALSGRVANEPRDAMQLAVAAGVDEFVCDLGFVPPEDLAPLYSGATMLVFPSLFEGFGLPLLEAMACGCPIAAADATAIPDCVGQAALLFDPFDPSAIAEAIHSLRTDADLRTSLSAQGLERARQYHWRDIVPQIVEVYHKAAGHRG